MANNFEKEIETPEMETLAGVAENLVYRLPGCADVMVRKTVQEVYRDFCRRSCCLRVRRQFPQEPGKTEFPVFPMYGGMVDAVVEVTIGRTVLVEGREYSVHGQFVKISEGIVSCNCDHDAHPVVITHVEIPKIGQESAPSWFIWKYGDVLCSGVAARLMSMTNRPWSDMSQAQVENFKYENGIGEARISFYSGSDGGCGYAGTSFDTSDLI